MRIAIAGKGGSGKTTISATMARTLAHRGLAVTALDGDPNANLGVALGFAEAQLARVRHVPREDILEERHDDEGRATLHLKRSFGDVLTSYGARGPDNIGLLAMTAVLGAGRG